MKSKFVLILSINILFAGVYITDSGAASATATNEKLALQLSQEKEKVKTLEAEIVKLRKTIGNLQTASAAAAKTKYTIKEGETITQIANRHGLSRKTLMQINDISENQQIYIGDVLILPAAPAPEKVVVKAAPTPSPVPKAAPAPTKKEIAKAPAPKPSSTPKSNKDSPIAWTKADQPKKNEKPKSVVPSKTVASKPQPKKIEPAKTPPAVVAKVEAKPATVAVTTPKKVKPQPESSIKDLAKAETKSTASDFTYYTIKFGDNLGKIAKKHGISVGALMNFNGLTNPDKISGGQKLKIPSKEKAKTLSKIKAITKPTTPTTVASSGNKPQPGDKYGVYIVQSGDTLYELARDFFTTEKEIQSLNKMGSKTNIAPGQELVVPTSEYFKKADLANN